MDMSRYYPSIDEKPLDRLPANGGLCRIFRKIGCVGDSLSSGEFQLRKEDGTFGYYDMYEYSWGQHIARMTGCTVYNFSRGGMTAREYCESFADHYGYWNPDKACQAYIIALGCNEFLQNAVVGTMEDIDFSNYHNNKPTYTGYYATIIQRLKEIQPRAKFFVMTMPREDNSDGSTLREELNERVRELADRFENTYLIDLYKYAPIYDKKFKDMFFLEGHMNPAGYVFTADIVAAYIDFIIRHNIKDFDEIGFIGTQLTNHQEMIE